MTEFNKRTVRRALRQLEDDGYIEIEQRYRERGYQTSSLYHLQIHKAQPLPRSTFEEDTTPPPRGQPVLPVTHRN